MRFAVHSSSLHPAIQVAKVISISIEVTVIHGFNRLSDSSHSSARGPARNVQALGALLPARDIDTTPAPSRAASRPAININIGCRALHGATHITERKSGDRNAGGRLPLGPIVRLLDHDAVLCDAAQRDILVGDALDRSRLAALGFDPHAVFGVDDLGVGEGYFVDLVVAASADGADREAVAAGAEATAEDDVLSRGS